jgi:aspartyl/asparaginyl beta-hydroxylase (cupin superfamily)
MGRGKLFYSFITRSGYEGDAPKYFDKNDFEWAKYLENNTHEIKSELLTFLAKDKELWPYFDKNIVSKKNSWKTIPFAAWNVKFRKNQMEAPKTMALLNSIPNLVSASFNMLDADSEILPHHGDTDGIMRCHLGLIIPGNLPEVGFEVDGESKSWEEGSLLIFCDAHKHRAWNHSKEQRFILLFDVIRPEFSSQKRQICAKVLASLYLQSLGSKIPILHKSPKVFQMVLYQIAILGARCTMPIRNLISSIFVR